MSLLSAPFSRIKQWRHHIRHTTATEANFLRERDVIIGELSRDSLRGNYT